VTESGAPQAVRATFANSYQALPEDARRLFATLAAVATAECGRQAVAALAAALDILSGRATIDALVRRALADAAVNESMPQESDRERLRLHALLRAFAAEAFAPWPAEQQAQAYAALAAHYTDYANPTEDLALAPDEANITGALEWLHANAADDPDPDLVTARNCSGMANCWRETGRTQAGLTYLPWGTAAAERVAERTGAERCAAGGKHHLLLRRFLGHCWPPA
jgi:hypothetical protein